MPLCWIVVITVWVQVHQKAVINRNSWMHGGKYRICRRWLDYIYAHVHLYKYRGWGWGRGQDIFILTPGDWPDSAHHYPWSPVPWQGGVCKNLSVYICICMVWWMRAGERDFGDPKYRAELTSALTSLFYGCHPEEGGPYMPQMRMSQEGGPPCTATKGKEDLRLPSVPTMYSSAATPLPLYFA